MKMSSFISAATTLVLLIHMNQPDFANGHRALLTWPWIPHPRAPFPWIPLPPPTAPVTPPAKPVTPPAKPETPPVKPITPPAKPETPPVKPVTPPAKPETPPVKPVTPPVKPETPPVKPVTPPVKPETPPVKPVTPPAKPLDPKEKGTCQMNYGSCVKLFKGLIHWEDGDITAGTECCSMFGGLVQYESAWCLCKSFKGQFFGINFDIPIAMNMTLNFCHKKLPNHFSCP